MTVITTPDSVLEASRAVRRLRMVLCQYDVDIDATSAEVLNQSFYEQFSSSKDWGNKVGRRGGFCLAVHFSRPGTITTIDKSLPRPSKHPRDINGLSSQSSRSRLSVLRMSRFGTGTFFVSSYCMYIVFFSKPPWSCGTEQLHPFINKTQTWTNPDP